MGNVTTKYEKTVLLTCRMTVEQIDDDNPYPLPEPVDVVAMFRACTRNQLISYKALAESRELPAFVTFTVEDAVILEEEEKGLRVTCEAARDTFEEFEMALRLLGRPTLAEAARIAKEGMARALIEGGHHD